MEREFELFLHEKKYVKKVLQYTTEKYFKIKCVKFRKRIEVMFNITEIKIY